MKVLIASSSTYRRTRYFEELSRNGFEVIVASNAIECLRSLRESGPEAMILETQLDWGGCDGVLSVRADEPHLESIPVLLVAADGITPSIYRLAPFWVQGFFGRVPSTYALITSLRLLGISTKAEGQ